jgi:Rod binding domain-containing protein
MSDLSNVNNVSNVVSNAVSNVASVGAPAAATPLTADQKQALSRLHQAATQLEGVFLEMVMNEMQDTVPKESIFGADSSNSEETWQGMLNNERSQAIASSGSLGIGKVLEQQLRAQVLSDAPHEAHVQVEGRIDP